MYDPYAGDIRLFAGDFEVNGWRYCDGREMSQSEYPELYDRIGTKYGNGRFRLPDLRGRAAVHAQRDVGRRGGFTAAGNKTLPFLALHYQIAVRGSGYAQETTLGEIRPLAMNFAPVGWAICDGSLLDIAKNPSFFEVIGNRFGGDGSNTLALPDLRGRMPIGAGSGPGLIPRRLGDKGTSALPPRGQAPTNAYVSALYCICVFGGVFPMRWP